MQFQQENPLIALGGTNAVSTERIPIRFFPPQARPEGEGVVKSSRWANSEISRPSTNRDRSFRPFLRPGIVVPRGDAEQPGVFGPEVTTAGIHGQITKAAVGQRNAPSDRRQISPAREAKTIPVPMPLRGLPTVGYSTIGQHLLSQSSSPVPAEASPAWHRPFPSEAPHWPGPRQPDEAAMHAPGDPLRRCPGAQLTGLGSISDQHKIKWDAAGAEILPGPHPEPPLLLMRLAGMTSRLDRPQKCQDSTAVSVGRRPVPPELRGKKSNWAEGGRTDLTVQAADSAPCDCGASLPQWPTALPSARFFLPGLQRQLQQQAGVRLRQPKFRLARHCLYAYKTLNIRARPFARQIRMGLAPTAPVKQDALGAVFRLNPQKAEGGWARKSRSVANCGRSRKRSALSPSAPDSSRLHPSCRIETAVSPVWPLYFPLPACAGTCTAAPPSVH